MKTVLLFGANGFVGRNIAEHFGKLPDIRFVAATREDCDLLKAQEVKAYIQKINPDYIISAAYIEVNSNVKPTKKYLNNNLKIPLNILKACRGRAVKQIVFFGSGLEYGDDPQPLREDHPLHPKNYYAYTKSQTTEQSLRLAEKLNLPLVVIRAFNLYGPHDRSSVLFFVITSMLAKREFSVTKGEQVRDFLYIEDLVSLVEKAVFNGDRLKKQDIVNGGYGQGVELRQVIEEIRSLTSYTEDYGIRPYRENEYFSQVADIVKAKQLLKWEPVTSIHKGLQKTIAWITNQDRR